MRITGRAIAVLVALALYFGVLLIPELTPAVRSTGAYAAYVLSLPVVLLCLSGIAAWAGIASLWLAHDESRAKVHRRRLMVSLAGLIVFVLVFGLSRSIDGALPTGSQSLPFDRSAWLDPASSQLVKGDITYRQKMLADVVNNVLPEHNQAEIESQLGRSLDTPYFRSTGRDLIYVLGPERDSYMQIDFEWLLVWCDRAGQFERYEIVTD